MDASMGVNSAARWDNLSVPTMDETTVERRDACWAGQKAALTDVPWVGQTDASTAVHSEARSVASTAQTKDEHWAGQKAASKAMMSVGEMAFV